MIGQQGPRVDLDLHLLHKITESINEALTVPVIMHDSALFDPADIDVVGQVTGVAMLLESRKRRPARTSTIPAKSPNP